MAAATFDPNASISGHLWLYEGKRKQVWCARWRDHEGRHEKRLGPAWQGKGPPPPDVLRRREAQALLDEILVEARRGTRRQARTGLTFRLLAEEWFEHGRFERDWSASTQVDYRSVLDAHLLRAFGSKRVESITSQDIQKWRDRFARETDADGELKRSRKTVNKIVVQMHAIFEHAVDRHGLLTNPVARVKRLRESNDPARFDFFSPDEIELLVATAAAGEHRDPSRAGSAHPARGRHQRAARHRRDRPGPHRTRRQLCDRRQRRGDPRAQTLPRRLPRSLPSSPNPPVRRHRLRRLTARRRSCTPGRAPPRRRPVTPSKPSPS
jgi:hypothetical protein